MHLNCAGISIVNLNYDHLGSWLWPIVTEISILTNLELISQLWILIANAWDLNCSEINWRVFTVQSVHGLNQPFILEGGTLWETHSYSSSLLHKEVRHSTGKQDKMAWINKSMMVNEEVLQVQYFLSVGWSIDQQWLRSCLCPTRNRESFTLGFGRFWQYQVYYHY